jgi:translocator protein
VKKFRQNYVIIPSITICVALVGSLLTKLGISWYNSTLVQPALTPPNFIFPIAWNIIFIMATMSALIVWNSENFEKKCLWIFKRKTKDFNLIIGLFVANAILNVTWILLFFSLELILPAFIEMIALEATTLLLMIQTWKHSKTASLLLLPYLLWVGFATILTYQILMLN